MPRFGWALASCIALMASIALGGCGSNAVAPPQSDAQDRIAKLMNLYRYYTDKNQKPPPNEEALREFGKKLTAEERSTRIIGDDLEGIFTSPRDNQKFNVKWNIKPDPAVNRALAWEATTGKDGMRWVALTNGYTVYYSDQQLQEVMK
jgi:hypothetical protein